MDEVAGKIETGTNASHQHFKMYKPAGVLSQFIFNHRKRKHRKLLGDVVENSGLPIPEGLMAIGRLDEDSEGLLLLTTDGKMSKRVRDRDVEKEYWVQVCGVATKDAIDKLSSGVEIALPAADLEDEAKTGNDGEPKRLYQTLPCHVHLLDTECHSICNSERNTKQNEYLSVSDAKPRKKFKGRCNSCGESGHKNQDCPLKSPHNQPSNINRRGNRSGTTMKMALPPGIPPTSKMSLSEESQHGPTTWISITVTEGKNRQIRRMTAAVGHPTLRLVRVRIGSVTLDGMLEGQVRILKQSELEPFLTNTK